jgi:EAL domain-containing protein (putative c-di-GMP-specific phosphodiesterase class I)
VVYQPKAELPAGRVVGFEALLRWQDPTHEEPTRERPERFTISATHRR